MSINELKTDGAECCIGARLEWRCDHEVKKGLHDFPRRAGPFCRLLQSYWVRNLGVSASSNRTYPALDNRTIGVSVAAGILPGRSAP